MGYAPPRTYFLVYDISHARRGGAGRGGRKETQKERLFFLMALSALLISRVEENDVLRSEEPRLLSKVITHLNLFALLPPSLPFPSGGYTRRLGRVLSCVH